ncbi:MAG: lysine--tRNA ligase [Omnitrophica WOR_2 bacterium]
MLSEFTNLEQTRLAKLKELQAQGIEVFPARSERTHTSKEAIQAFEAAESAGQAEPLKATLVGRLRSMRPMGKITFAHIEDGAGRIQILLRADEVGKEQMELFNREFDLGDFIQASGELFRTRTGEVTLRVNAFHLLAKSITPLPAAKDEVVDGQVIRHATLTDPETRYRQRYADLAINPQVRAIFQTRAAIIRALRSFLDNQGFLEVETPVLQPIYGGAAARPFITHHNELDQDLYLRISFELYLKRLLVGGFERVYEIGRDFRNEGVSFKHNPEFTMLEFYMAYADFQMVMNLTEAMIVHVADCVMGRRTINFQGNEINLETPWRRLTLRESLIEIGGIDINDYPTANSLVELMRSRGLQPDPHAPRGKLIERLVGDLVEPKLIQPTFLYDYPRAISPLAKSKPGDPDTVERFEGFLGGMEICNAFSELNDPLDQEARFLEMGRDYTQEDEERHPMDEDYLRALRYGMPPTGGFGMGIDRLVMLFTNNHSIREVILFPPLRNRED